MRYYQLVASGRQLAVFIVVMAGLFLLSFLVGLSLGLAERQERLETAGSGPDAAPPGAMSVPVELPPSTPTPLPTPAPQVVAPAPTAVPTPVPTVTLRPSPRPSPVEGPLPRGVWVQVGAFTSKADAEGVRHRVVALGFRPEQVRVLPLTAGKYRVRVGPFPDRESGSRVVARLREGGFREAFVVSE